MWVNAEETRQTSGVYDSIVMIREPGNTNSLMDVGLLHWGYQYRIS